MVSSMSLSEVVSSQGRFIAGKTARGTAQSEQPTGSGAQRPPGLPPPFLPPFLGPGRRGCRGDAVGSSRLFPTPQPGSAARTGAGHAPPRGRGYLARLPRLCPHRPAGFRLLGVGVARDWLGRRGGAALVPARGEPPAEAWERCRAPRVRELRAGGRGSGEREREVVNSARAARGRGRGGGGPRGAGSRPRVSALLLTSRPQSGGEVAVLCLKNNPKRVAECERACSDVGRRRGLTEPPHSAVPCLDQKC